MAAIRKWGKQPKFGTFVLSGNMGLQAGSACHISRKTTLLKLLNMPLPRICLIPLLLSGGGSHVLKKRTRTIAAATKRYHKRTHKFVIEVPNIWKDCVRLDKENDNTLWQDEVRKEMKNVRIAFKILNGEESVPTTYQEILCHMIYDVKMEDFRRKARFVAGGHTTYTPHAMTYTSVVSR
jgi:hypothetical protein